MKKIDQANTQIGLAIRIVDKTKKIRKTKNSQFMDYLKEICKDYSKVYSLRISS